MKSIISPAIVKENLKRFWSTSALAFFVMFLSGPYVLWTNYNNGSYSYYFIEELMANQNAGYIFIECALPVILAVCLFSYLNKPNSVNAIHAQPVSRKKLFLSNYVSGVILFLAPILLTALITLVLKNPVESLKYDWYEGMEDGYNALSILVWLLTAFTDCLFTFSVSCLACIVCGNGVIATLTSFAFNMVVPATILCFIGYASNEYWGYAYDSNIYTILEYTHPIVILSINFDLIWMIIFLVISAAITALCVWAYQNRQLEKATDAYVFKLVKNIVGFLFEFYFTTMLGLALYEEWGIAAYIVGGVFGFVIGQMISRKTFKIFDIESLKNLVVFSVILVVIIGAIKLDITGYEKRVPSAGSVEKVYVQCPSTLSTVYNLNWLECSSAEGIQEAIDFHENLIENRNTIQKSIVYDEYGSYAGNWSYVSFDYELKNGKTIQREYYVPTEYVTAFLKEYKFSDEYINMANSLKSINPDYLTIVLDLYNKGDNKAWSNIEKDYIEIDNGKDTASLWKAVCNDVSNIDILSDNGCVVYGSMSIDIEMPFNSQAEADAFAKSLPFGTGYAYETGRGSYETSADIYISDLSTETIAWITEYINNF